MTKYLFISCFLLLPFVRTAKGQHSPLQDHGVGTSSLSTISPDSSECEAMLVAVRNLAGGTEYQKQYDSARYFIEHCAPYKNSPTLFKQLPSYFTTASSGCRFIGGDVHRWISYRDWLEKVLYYRLDSGYYCHDAISIYGSVYTFFDDAHGADVNAAIAILKMFVDSNRCTSYFPNGIGDAWAHLRQSQHLTWSDTVSDPTRTPFEGDTAIPSLESHDLQVLLGPQYAGVSNAFSASAVGPKIGYVRVSENPFNESAELCFGLADAEYVRLEIFDPLGKRLWSDERLFGSGDQRWRVEGTRLAPGTLYARLSTLGGEVKTLKLIKQ